MSNSQATTSYTVSHAIDAYGFGLYQILLSVIVGKFLVNRLTGKKKQKNFKILFNENI